MYNIFKQNQFDNNLSPNPIYFQSKSHLDNRGSFFVGYNNEQLNKCLKQQSKDIEDFNIIQQNTSISKKYVFRGFHYQYINPQAKLVNCITGCVIDFIIDIRSNSKTKGKLVGYYLNDPTMYLYVPIGFSHGFVSLQNNTMFQYLVSDVWNKQGEAGIHASYLLDKDIPLFDKDIVGNIKIVEHVFNKMILSDKDNKQISFQDFLNNEENNDIFK